ncbi:hypothetical protein AAC387_Pa01g0925 [Persea americana]
MEAFSNTASLFLFIFLFLSFLSSSSSNATCNPIDRAALLHFKSKITHDPSNLLRTWNYSTDCCTKWEGVACNSVGRVVNVSRLGLFSGDDFITDTSMTGTLSSSLANLSSLQILNLSNLKDLSGPIPPQLGSLINLTHLYLDSNALTGQIPSTFQNLIHLEKLRLNSDRLLGVTPSIFQSLASLSELGLSSNSLSSNIPETIGGLVSLDKLDLSANKIIRNIPSAIGELNKLTSLDLSNNQITGSIPPSIGRLSKLNTLDLSQNNHIGNSPTSIAYFKISENSLTGGIPPSIGQLTTIQRPFVSHWVNGSQSTYRGISWRGLLRFDDVGDRVAMDSIKHLVLSHNQIGGRIPESVMKLKNLVQFDVSENRLSGCIPEHIVSIPAANFRGNQLIMGWVEPLFLLANTLARKIEND